MLSEAQIKSVALFFYCGFLDETKAREATLKVHDYFSKKNRGRIRPAKVKPREIVKLTWKVWKQGEKLSTVAATSTQLESYFKLPQKMDLGPWREFKRTVPMDEFLCLLWSQILEFKDKDIAEALNVSTGTVRYRVGRGLSHLGMMHLGESK